MRSSRGIATRTPKTNRASITRGAAAVMASLCLFFFTAPSHAADQADPENPTLQDRITPWTDSDPLNDSVSPSSGIIHVLVNNLHGGPPHDIGGLHVDEEERIGTYIKDIAPDIALLQESGVSQSKWRYGKGAGADQNCESDCSSETFPTMNHPDWRKRHAYHVLVPWNGDGLSTWTSMPMSNVAHVDFENCFGSAIAGKHLADCFAIKGFTFARVAVGPDDQEIHIYNTHTDSAALQDDMDIREEQFAELGRWIEDHSADEAVIVVGDFNTEIIDPELPNTDIVTLRTFRSDHNLHDARDFFGARDTSGGVDNLGHRPNSRGWIWREKWGSKYIEGFDQIYFRSGDDVKLTLVDFMMDEPFLTDHPMLHGYFHWSVDGSLPPEVDLFGSHMYEFRQGESDYVSIDGGPPEPDPSFVDMREAFPRGHLNNHIRARYRDPALNINLNNNRDKYNQCCDFLQLGYPVFHVNGDPAAADKGAKADFYQLTQAPPEIHGATSDWTMMISVALHNTPPFCDDHKGNEVNCTWGDGSNFIDMKDDAAAEADFPRQPIFNNESGFGGSGFKLYLSKLHASPLGDNTLNVIHTTEDWKDGRQGAYWNQFCLEWPGGSPQCSGPLTENDLDHGNLDAGKPGMHTIQPDHWYDITITHAMDGKMAMFVDGREVNTWTDTDHDFGGDGYVWLGKDPELDLSGAINVEHMYFFDRVLQGVSEDVFEDVPEEYELAMMRSHDRLLPPLLVCAPDLPLECTSPHSPGGIDPLPGVIDPPPDLVDDGTRTFHDDVSARDALGLGTVTRTWEGFVSDDPIEYPAMCTQLITIVDTTEPTIGGPPDDMTLDPEGVSGAVVTFPFPMATDLCDPLGLDVVCVAPSGSLFEPGATPVQCTATDSSGNQGSYSFTVTVRTASETIMDVKDTLQALLPTGDAKTDRRIEDAIRRLEESLDDAYWIDGFTLTDRGGRVFGGAEKAVHSLSKIDPSDPAIDDAIARLVQVERILAQTALDAAISSGGNAKAIAGSEAAMRKGDDDALGRHFKAIGWYRIAWGRAT